MAVLGTVELFRITVDLIGSTMDDAVFGRDASHFVVVVCHVGTYTISEVLSDLVVPGKPQFDTFVFHVTTVDDRAIGTCRSQYGSLHQPVLSVLDVPVGGECEATI